MKTLALLTIQLTLLLTTPCLAQQQLAWPLNPQLGGFPPGHPGIPTVISTDVISTEKWTAAQLNVGDVVLLEMRDRPAAAYLKLLGHDIPDTQFGIAIEARVVKLEDSNVVLEFQTTVSRETDSAKLITVTSMPLLQQILEPPQYKYSMPVSATDGDNENMIRQLQTRQANLPYVRIDNFAHTKIRTWTLATEINE